MAINEVEMDAALKKVADKTGQRPSKSLAMNLAHRVTDLMAGERHYPFRDARELAMNDLRVRFEERPALRSVLGSCFGQHGGRRAARNRAAGKPPEPKKVDPTLEVVVEKTGQMAFRV